ncbi:DUF2065 domain-containing protein [Acuticoccus yangtzensis]|uniref:DUF2065 domain-containing protein n=1 Tax=Acuticoccus yangtzensis TaxID=1443441 RepID=UPI0009498C3A|nr:DUF2065 domain-containing protein [Acuticoccus yangtzensis]ORE95453.1 hypothetical protein ATO13_01305 [Stappia sp. 22II-S9-Z10]
MSDLVSALGLVLVLEGALYALAPGAMRDMMSRMMTTPDDVLRMAGLAAAVVGVLLVWIVRAA